MIDTSTSPSVAPRLAAHRRGEAPWLLRAVAVTVFVFPANIIFDPLGANGFVAMVLALILVGVWVASALWGLHDPVIQRHPARLGLGILWLVTVASFVAMGGGPATVQGKLSAERWVITLLAITGIVCVTADFVRTREQLASLVRALVLGATFCAAVGIYQFFLHTDPVHYWTDLMVGMTDNGGRTTFQQRSQFVRVAGTTFTPIELGVVMVMVFPLAVWRCIYDPSRRRWVAWAQCLVILAAAVFTVSRSMILSLLAVTIVMVPFLPVVARRWAYILVPTGVVAVFALVPGMVATMLATITITTTSNDPSITTRLNNYPRVEAMVHDRPLLGSGPGTYLPVNALKILDNEYLKVAVEMGLLGVFALIAFLVLPTYAAFFAACNLRDPAMKALAGGVAGAGLASVLVSATFDSLSFPTFTIVFAFVAGLSGSVWLVARNQPEESEIDLESDQYRTKGTERESIS